MSSQGWSIKVGNLAEPIRFNNTPKLTHSTAKGGTTFSFDVFGSPILPWTSTEKAKVEVLYSGEQVFLGNIASRSRDFDNYLTNYNAIGYYTHTRRNPIIGKFDNSFSSILNQLLDTSGARPFISSISYHLGNIANSENSILNVELERQYIGQYLDACLDDLCKAAGIQWFIEPETGFLVLWQHTQISSNKEIDIEANRLGTCQQFKHDSIKPSFIHPEVTRVVVAKNSESLLNRNVPQMDTINNYLILPNSPANQVDLLRKTDVVKSYFITTATIINDGGCTTSVSVNGNNFTTSNSLFDFDYYFPETSTEQVSLIYIADIANVEETSNFSFYLDGSIDTTEANLTISFEGTEIYNQALNSTFLGTTTSLSLKDYKGQTGQLIATITLPTQTETFTNYNAFLSAHCCAINTLIGTGNEGFSQDGSSALSNISNPNAVRKHSDGSLYFCDTGNYRIRKLDPSTNTITTVVGNGNPATNTPTSNSLATNIDLGQVSQFVIADNFLYIVLVDWVMIGKVDLDTGIFTVLHTGTPLQNNFTHIALDSSKNIYYTDIRKDVIWKLTEGSSPLIYAGVANSAGFSGDGGLATNAQLNNPKGLAFDSQDNLYIYDSRNFRVRKIAANDGSINTVVGGGTSRNFGISPLDFDLFSTGTSALAVNPLNGNIYLSWSSTILKVNIIENTINRFAGIESTAGNGFAGDGGSPITAIFDFGGFFSDGAIEFISEDEFYISDEANHRIRKISCGDLPVTPCPDTSLIITNPSSSASGGQIGSILTNPFIAYSGGNLFPATETVLSLRFDIDLTNPGFVGHQVKLDIYFGNVIAVTQSNTLSVGASIKFNGETFYSLNRTESINGIGGLNEIYENIADISQFIGQILHIDIDVDSTFTQANGTTFGSNFVAKITC